MRVFDRYLFKHLFIATVFTAVALAVVILLTQSLRFLELVVGSGASSATFWILALLTLPRFLEIILPVALTAATLFVYNRMTADSELVVMRAFGASPLRMAQPALYLSGLVALILLVLTLWLAPVSQASMYNLRQVVKAQYSSLLFKEGVFSPLRPGLTAFIRNRMPDGELRGIMIHDSRTETPVTIIARRGTLVSSAQGQQILVYDGSRQDINKKTGGLNRLDFDRYTIDIPESTPPIEKRWLEPDQRTLWQLLRPDQTDAKNEKITREFIIELNRRVVSPLLAPGYTIITLAFLLLGPLDRRGQGWRIVFAITATILVQGLYLASVDVARHSLWGLGLLNALVFLPLVLGLLFLAEIIQRKKGGSI